MESSAEGAAGEGRMAAPLLAAVPRLMQQFGVPGVSVATIEGGVVAWRQGFGLARLEPATPVSPRTVFEAASLSKPVFAYAVLGLCARGRLDLDTPLLHYLPSLFPTPDERLSLVTARHVLAHTGGFHNLTWGDEPAQAHLAPGERFSYSSAGYEYLQFVIEAITGEPLAAYLRRQVLDPFGMSDSSFVWLDGYDSLSAIGYDGHLSPRTKERPARGRAGGTLHCPAVDFARFM
ncbi:MAG: serine hydrolase domain-containing protein, partial [Anaerolineae bacterium]